MGYYVYAYLVDLERLRQVYGSNDPQLYSSIVDKFAADLTYADNELAGWNEERAELGSVPVLNVSEALCRSIAGQIPTTHDQFFSYAWALEFLCRRLGTTLPNTNGMDYMSPYGVRFIETEVQLIADLVFRSGPPGPIPFPSNFGDGFIIGHLRWEQAAQQLSAWHPVVISEDPVDRAWEERVCEQYQTWLKAAVWTRRGIVTFFS
jgi:hypothetical protein